MTDTPQVGDEIIVTNSMNFYRRTRFIVMDGNMAQPISETNCWQNTKQDERPLNLEPVQMVLKMTGESLPRWTIWGTPIEKVRF
jgi:hypothetical protein